MAITAALYRRDRHPNIRTRARGEWLQLSMSGAALSLLAPAYAPELISGIAPPRNASTAFSGSPLSGTFEAKNGFLAVVCNTVDQAQGLLRALQEASTPADALSALQQAALQGNVTAAQEVLAELLRARTVADWESRLTPHGVPVTAVATAAEAAKAASVRWPHVALPAVAGGSTVRVPGIWFDSSEPLTVNLSAPPLRGADTRVLLAECGLDAGTIDAMLSEGAAWAPAE